MCERRARYDPSGRCFVGQQTLGVSVVPVAAGADYAGHNAPATSADAVYAVPTQEGGKDVKVFMERDQRFSQRDSFC